MRDERLMAQVVAKSQDGVVDSLSERAVLVRETTQDLKIFRAATQMTNSIESGTCNAFGSESGESPVSGTRNVTEGQLPVAIWSRGQREPPRRQDLGQGKVRTSADGPTL